MAIPFDIGSSMPFVNVRVGRRLKTAAGIDMLAVSFQHGTQFDPDADCYFGVIGGRRDGAGFSFYSNIAGNEHWLVMAMHEHDAGAEASDIGGIRSLLDAQGAGVGDAVALVRMAAALLRWVLSSRKVAGAAKRYFAGWGKDEWSRPFYLAKQGLLAVANGIIGDGRAAGRDLGVGPGEDVELDHNPLDFVVGEGTCFVRQDASAYRWIVETRPGKVYLVHRDGCGDADRVTRIFPTTEKMPFVEWLPGEALDFPRGKVVAAMFDDETRQKFRLLRQDVCEVVGVLSVRGDEFLSVVNDDGVTVGVRRARAEFVFTE